MSVFDEYSYVSTPADRRSFVGYHHAASPSPFDSIWTTMFPGEYQYCIEEVLLDRFRDMIMEVEGIQEEDEKQEGQLTDQDFWKLLQESLEKQPLQPAQPNPWASDPDQRYGGPIWIVEPSQTIPPTSPGIYIGDPPHDVYTINTTGTVPPQRPEGPYSISGNGFTVSTLGDGSWVPEQ